MQDEIREFIEKYIKNEGENMLAVVEVEKCENGTYAQCSSLISAHKMFSLSYVVKQKSLLGVIKEKSHYSFSRVSELND